MLEHRAKSIITGSHSAGALSMVPITDLIAERWEQWKLWGFRPTIVDDAFDSIPKTSSSQFQIPSSFIV